MNPDYSRAILDAVPLPIFVVDKDVRIVDCNVTAAKMLGPDPELIIRRQGGEVLHCVHSKGVGESCGCGPECNDCVVRNAVQAAYLGQSITREKTRMEFVTGSEVKAADLLVTCHPFTYAGRRLALLILEDVSELMALRSLLPICAKCKKIRDDRAYWHSLERYFSIHMNVDFSHGLCPDCAAELYPEIFSKPPAA